MLRDAAGSARTDLSDLVASHLADVPDFPVEGVVFKDITPLVEHAETFRAVIEGMAERYRDRVDIVAGIESRGFVFAAALAHALGTGFVPVRKPGKLPARTLTQDYQLEYGSDRLEIHADALPPGARVLVVDDVLATGGTLRAATALLRRQGADVVGAGVLVELAFLRGRERWDDPAPLRAAWTVT